jgi:hypothetical protein
LLVLIKLSPMRKQPTKHCLTQKPLLKKLLLLLQRQTLMRSLLLP